MRGPKGPLIFCKLGDGDARHRSSGCGYAVHGGSGNRVPNWWLDRVPYRSPDSPSVRAPDELTAIVNVPITSIGDLEDPRTSPEAGLRAPYSRTAVGEHYVTDAR